MKAILLTGLAIGLLGCASSQDFRPADDANAHSIPGYPATVYNVQSGTGPVGRVRVWSRGAYKTKLGDHKATVVKVSIEVANASQQPTRIDLQRTWLDALQVGSDSFPLSASWYEGTAVVAPESVGTESLYFVLPASVKPSDVDGYRLRWELTDGLGHRYLQWTPFVQDNPPEFYYYGDPYLWAPWPSGFIY